MKQTLSVILLITLLASGLFILTGCDNNKNGGKAKNTTEISYDMGKGKITVSVPKKEDGTPKYQFTTTQPEGSKQKGTFYLATDTAFLSFSSSGLVYNTSKYFKETYGEQKATFDGYLEFMKDEKSTIKLSGMEQFELNGRKALRYYNRVGGSGNYKYWGYFYMIAADDVYPGSHMNMTVNYKDEEKPSEVREFDQETLDIINSFKLTLNQ